jgi:hypothetical protein
MTDLPHITTDQFLTAIREGISDAIWRIATNATSMPCADFFAAIEDGTTEGVRRVGRITPAADGDCCLQRQAAAG